MTLKYIIYTDFSDAGIQRGMLMSNEEFEKLRNEIARYGEEIEGVRGEMDSVRAEIAVSTGDAATLLCDKLGLLGDKCSSLGDKVASLGKEVGLQTQMLLLRSRDGLSAFASTIAEMGRIS
jgi:hypothetical protein